MEELINFVSQVGFPIATALFLMLRMDKTIKANTEALKELVFFIKNKEC